jgi:hypothetical protein
MKAKSVSLARRFGYGNAPECFVLFDLLAIDNFAIKFIISAE